MTTMDDHEFLARRFDAHEDRLRSLALRMLGSHGGAEEALREARGRLDEVERWLEIAVGRACVGRLRTRSEEGFGRRGATPEPEGPRGAEDGVDSVWLALLVVLDSLAADERLAYALHDLFGLPLREVARITGCTPGEAGRLAGRARLRVRGAGGEGPQAEPEPRRRVVEVFLAAARERDARALAAVLDPDVVAYSENGSVHGAPAVAEGAAAFARLAGVARPALVNGAPGVVAFREGRPVRAVAFTIRGERITVLDITTDEERLRGLDLVFPEW
ncbi:sigma factor-like helix-turn-helix DNA-binding protein [Streptomyces sp. NPDC056527]|uniref:sigma factor-like helix-turn-helix DNA-binding protein n=1 Tax=Streptomyces sp. NPDC056527 TaxID=3345853 RepID=UPI0036C10952